MSVPAHHEAIRSCQLRRLSQAHWREAGAQAGKEGKPVAQRVTTTTASKNLVGMRRHLTLTRHPAAGGQVREEWPLRCT
jgi:hypothetical protein